MSIEDYDYNKNCAKYIEAHAEELDGRLNHNIIVFNDILNRMSKKHKPLSNDASYHLAIEYKLGLSRLLVLRTDNNLNIDYSIRNKLIKTNERLINIIERISNQDNLFKGNMSYIMFYILQSNDNPYNLTDYLKEITDGLDFGIIDDDTRNKIYDAKNDIFKDDIIAG